MDILSAEFIEKLISPKDITTFVVIWFFIKSRIKDHFFSIESSLDTIAKNIKSLEEKLMEQIASLDERVTKLEGR